MKLERALEEIGARNNVGVASICCKNEWQIKRMWKEIDIGYVVLKTFMDSEDNPGERAFTDKQPADQNMTLFHTGTTSKEGYNFETQSSRIIELLDSILSYGIAAIPSIATKKTDEAAWETMQRPLAKSGVMPIELNLRYTYRGLTSKYAEEIREATGRNIACDEYFSKNILGTVNRTDREEFYIRDVRGRTLGELYFLIGR
jgi:hypothetical protein